MSPFDRDVLVSPDYVVVECDDSKLLPSYLQHLRHSHKWRRHFELAGNGSVRARIYYDDLGRFTFLLPPSTYRRVWFSCWMPHRIKLLCYTGRSTHSARRSAA
jgi:hypothetical protein